MTSFFSFTLKKLTYTTLYTNVLLEIQFYYIMYNVVLIYIFDKYKKLNLIYINIILIIVKNIFCVI